MDDPFEDQLSSALVARPTLEQAKGILAGLRCLTPDEAFDEIRAAARVHGVGLQDLAAALVRVASGEEVEDALLRKVIWQEWREVLSDC
jgi:ANTAR domain